MENKRFLTAQNVMKMLDVSLSYAYKLIRRLNAELEAEGFVTIKGRVSTQYFMERIYGLSTDKEVGWMAVIKNKKTGMWKVRTYYKDLTGERKQKTKRGFAKKSETIEWERNFKLKENQSISMSFQSFVDIYLTDLEPRIKRNTFLTKKHIIETKILPYFGKRKLDDIRTSNVIQWQNEIMKLKKDNGELFSPTYLKTIHNQLSAILNHAVNKYGLKDNLARKAGTMRKKENKEMEFWTQEEFQRFLECVADKLISYYAFEMLYWTALIFIWMRKHRICIWILFHEYPAVREDWKQRRALRQHLLPEDLQARVKETPNGSSGQRLKKMILPLSCVGTGLTGRRKTRIISIYPYWIIRSRSG